MESGPQLFGANAEVLQHDEQCSVLRLWDDTGAARLTSYALMPGVTLTFNDMRLAELSDGGRCCEDIIEIEYCRTGRCEHETGDDMIFLSPGDIAVHRIGTVGLRCWFPLCHYEGATLTISLAAAPPALCAAVAEAAEVPRTLAEKFCHGRICTVFPASAALAQLFAELYAAPLAVRAGYLKLKVMELLLLLHSEAPAACAAPAAGITRAQVGLAKQVSHYLCGNMSRRITIEEAAARFGVSATQVKLCIRRVYGTSFYAFIRMQKMQAAAVLLRTTGLTVLEIAGRFGYDNGSKFAKAFRTVMGVTPSEYRRQHPPQRPASRSI